MREQYPHRRGRRRRSPFGLILAGVVLVAIVAGVIYALVHSSSSSGTSSSKVCDATSVADGVLPSVVTISANGATGAGNGLGRGDPLRRLHPHQQPRDLAARQRRRTCRCCSRTARASTPTITGRDPQTDLAVLNVTPPFDLKVIAIGKSGS